jgi:GNAT superfamily N-acetyltransferase
VERGEWVTTTLEYGDAAVAVIRAGRPDDAKMLRSIERLAGERFADVGMADVADAEPMAAALLVSYAEAGRCWVATGAGERPVGFVVVDVVDDCAHIAQISATSTHQGRGLARGLLRAAERWAIEQSISAMTLSTFDAVAWNRPLYEHLGFSVLDAGQIGPGLRAVRRAEQAQGLDPSTRVCMRREVRQDGTPSSAESESDRPG